MSWAKGRMLVSKLTFSIPVHNVRNQSLSAWLILEAKGHLKCLIIALMSSAFLIRYPIQHHATCKLWQNRGKTLENMKHKAQNYWSIQETWCRRQYLQKQAKATLFNLLLLCLRPWPVLARPLFISRWAADAEVSRCYRAGNDGVIVCDGGHG